MSRHKEIGTITAVGSPLSLETYWISASAIVYSLLRFGGSKGSLRDDFATRHRMPRTRRQFTCTPCGQAQSGTFVRPDPRSESPRPLPASIEYREQLQPLAPDPVRNDVRR